MTQQKQEEGQQTKINRRDLSSLKEWARENDIVISPFVSITSSKNSSGDNDYGVSIKKNKSLKKGDVILKVPKNVIVDSKGTGEFSNSNIISNTHLLEEALEYIRSSGLQDPSYGQMFILFVKIINEYVLGKSSTYYTWIKSLPKSYDTAVCFDDIEISCLPPLALVLANVQRQQLDIFRRALKILLKKDDNINDNDKNNPASTVSILDAEKYDELTLWAFNVITTRCWSYQEEKEQPQQDNGQRNNDSNDDSDNSRPIAVPFGDMFNHRDPPNVMIRNAKHDDDAIEFVLLEDIINVGPEEEGEENVGGGNSGGGEGLYLSYGLTTNPHRFLTVFGFIDESMPCVFSQLLFDSSGGGSNLVDSRLIDLGCNDRSKMIYRTIDGSISNTVWDCILYNLLDQVPAEQEIFYGAHINNDIKTKKELHDKYALEECLILRTHVINTLNEFRDCINHIDDQRSMTKITEEEKETENFGNDNNNGAMFNGRNHPRLQMIRRYNVFMHETFNLVLKKIDSRAQNETLKRRRTKSDESQ